MKVEASLQKIYAEFPSLKVNADKRALQTAATKVLGPAQARALLAALIDKDKYLAARRTVLDALLQAPEPQRVQSGRTIVVAGLSSGGTLAAIVAARSGYRVEAFEARGAFVREMQFNTRQAAIDELASIDPRLAEDFLKKSAGFLKGAVSIRDGEREVGTRDAPRAGDPLAVPDSGEAMLADEPISVVECEVMESLVFDYLKTVPGITIHNGLTVAVGEADAEGNFSATASSKDGKTTVDLGRPFLIIGATGGNTPMRKAVGIETAVTSPAMEFVGGVVEKGLGGLSIEQRDDRKRADGTTERVIKMALGSAILNKTWVMIGKSKDKSFEPAAQLDPRSPEYRAAKQELIEKDFRQEAALVMETQLEGVAMHGPFAGTKPTLFTVQQRMSNKAAAGNNFVGGGDFVGQGNVTVGGGAATATTAHVERLKKLFFDLELGVDKQAALTKYSDGAIADSMAWGRRGISEFYPDVDKQLLDEAWVTSVRDWTAGKNKDPLAAMEKMLVAQGALTLAPIGEPAAA